MFKCNIGCMDENKKPYSNSDLDTVRHTLKWLYHQKQLYQFIHHGIVKKRNELKLFEENALQKAIFFQARIKKELEKYPEILNDEDEKDEEDSEE